jgi:hypothetical protein
VDLTAFLAAVDAAMEARDESTGVVPEGPLAEVTKQYRELDGIKAKNAAKAEINERLKDAVNRLAMYEGKALMGISEVLTAGAAPAKEKVPTDPTEAYVQRLATLDLAFGLVSANAPEGVDKDAATAKSAELVGASQEAASRYLAWLNETPAEGEEKSAEPEVSGVVKSAVKLATGKSAKVGGRVTGGATAYTGDRRDIAEHIRQAFADKESGTFMLIAEIRNHKSTEYGDNPPSAGAISARLFPKSGKCTLDFVKPDTNANGNKGATKI